MWLSLLVKLVMVLSVLSGIGILLTRNTVMSIFYLILLFINGSIVFIALDAEFLGLIFIVVYVGAVAVLFLFVVMMLNVKLLKMDRAFVYYPIGLFLISVCGVGFYYHLNRLGSAKIQILGDRMYTDWLSLLYSGSNIEGLGYMLFIYQFVVFLMCGMVLLLAMVAAIYLTLNRNPVKSKKVQDLYKQHEAVVVLERITSNKE